MYSARSCTDITRCGFPHSDIHGSTLACSSPWLFAASHVLHRLLVPRHPPNALNSLTTKPFGSRVFPLATRRQLAKARASPSSGPTPTTRPDRCVGAAPRCSRTHVRSAPVLAPPCARLARYGFGTHSSLQAASPAAWYPRRFLSDSHTHVVVLSRASFIYSIVSDCSNSAALSSCAVALRPLQVGQERLELSTPRLSSVCSNQLSYWPLVQSVSQSRIAKITARIDRASTDFVSVGYSRKEVIQPQVPLRLPCYDFTPVTSHSLGGCLTRLAHRLLEQLTPMV